MGKYSDIDSIHIKNFKSLGDIDLKFGNNKILGLRGLGEGGKSSVRKAVACCLSNKDATKHKRHIRNGTKGFSVTVTLDDGTSIQRIKSDVDNTISIKGDGVDYRTNKIDRGSNVIEELYKVAGISCENETKEFLHYRSYDDLLLFVNTSGSTNFKVIRDILNLEELTQAIKNGNKDCNAKKSEINSNLKYKADLVANYDSIKVVDMDSLSVLVTRLEKNLKVLQELKYLRDLQNNVKSIKEKVTYIDSLGYNKLLDFNTKINNIYKQVASLESIYGLKEKLMGISKDLSKYSVLDNIVSVDIKTLNKLSLLGDLSKLSAKVKVENSKLGLYKRLDNVNKVDIGYLIDLKGVRDIYNKYKVCRLELKHFDSFRCLNKLSNTQVNKLIDLKVLKDKMDKELVDLKGINTSILDLRNEIEVSGYNYCTNCNHIYK